MNPDAVAAIFRRNMTTLVTEAEVRRRRRLRRQPPTPPTSPTPPLAA